jgi:hypothetical protein
MKPAPVPSILSDPRGLPDSTAVSTGSTATMCTASSWTRRREAIPALVAGELIGIVQLIRPVAPARAACDTQSDDKPQLTRGAIGA